MDESGLDVIGRPWFNAGGSAIDVARAVRLVGNVTSQVIFRSEGTRHCRADVFPMPDSAVEGFVLWADFLFITLNGLSHGGREKDQIFSEAATSASSHSQ